MRLSDILGLDKEGRYIGIKLWGSLRYSDGVSSVVRAAIRIVK